MSRLRIELPSIFPFRTALDVRVTDLNYGNHLGNDALLGLLHEARVRFLASHGYSELDVQGVGILMADCALIYKAQGRLGDRLEVEMAVGEFSRSGFELFYRVLRGATELARAKTGIVFYDYAAEAVRPVPPGFRALFGAK
jgi:acyl-CoA thioesterase FadM